jgi:hypothetical protein
MTEDIGCLDKIDLISGVSVPSPSIYLSPS